jgi:hypothetical protein
MPLARCIRPCWDSQTTRHYSQGNVADLPEDHVFLAGRIKCFELVKPEDLITNQGEAQVQLKKAFEMIGELSRKIEGDTIPKEPDPTGEKRPVSRSSKTG